jgi:5-formyltetrahydrofolate cyclo-ligase
MAVPPTLPTAQQSKAEMRAALRARRCIFATGHIFMPDLSRVRKLDALRGFIGRATVIAAYWPSGHEADPLPLLQYAHRLGKKIALPRFEHGTGAMSFHVWAPDQPTDCHRGYVMPEAGAPLAHPDLIFAPLIGFDHALNRLGQGGGFYDRAFAAYPHAIKIGIAWSVQEVTQLPVEPHDIPLDAILTEKEWITR